MNSVIIGMRGMWFLNFLVVRDLLLGAILNFVIGVMMQIFERISNSFVLKCLLAMLFIFSYQGLFFLMDGQGDPRNFIYSMRFLLEKEYLLGFLLLFVVKKLKADF